MCVRGLKEFALGVLFAKLKVNMHLKKNAKKKIAKLVPLLVCL